MSMTSLHVLLTLLVSVIILFEISASGPGLPCNEDTVPGDCTPLINCLPIFLAFKQNRTKFQACYIDPQSPLPYVCCPNGKKPSPPSTTPSTPINNRFQVIPKTGSISLQKCYEYAKLVFTKKQSVALIEGPQAQIDDDNCVKTVEGLIVDGQLAQLGEFPHMALLGYGDNITDLDYNCGGSLISAEFVLTAAHCATSTLKYVLLGEWILDDDDEGYETQLIQVRDIIQHPQYKYPAHYFDIALVKMSKPAILGPKVRPACIHDGQAYNTNWLTATGWGQTSYGGDKSDTLMKVNLNQVNDTICNRTHKDPEKLNKGFLSEQQLCVGKLAGGKDTCQGDSGGPLQVFLTTPHCTYLIIGVTSFGKGCALKNTPGVYTKVEYFREWIESIVWPQIPADTNTAANTTKSNTTDAAMKPK